MTKLFNLKYDCTQPVFYLGSALTSLAAVTVHLAKLNKNGSITTINMIMMLIFYILIIYAISRLINWACVKRHNNTAWVIALLPIIAVLATSFEY